MSLFQNDDEDFDTYCVIIGRDLGFECDVEVCEGIDSCPYVPREHFSSNTENKN